MRTIIYIFIVVLFVLSTVAYAANVTIVIPDEKIDRIVAGVCGQYDYQTNKQDEETQTEFTKRMIKVFLRETTLAYEYEQEKAAIAQEELDIGD